MYDRNKMLNDAAELVEIAAGVRERIAHQTPDRLPVAEQMVDDSAKVYFLIETSPLRRQDREEIAARLMRATLLAEALNRPVC